MELKEKLVALRKEKGLTQLACVVMISCITNVAAIQEEVADDFVEYNTESILTTRAIGEFEMTVSAKTKAIADNSLSLEAGDTVRINASYSPDGSVDFTSGYDEFGRYVAVADNGEVQSVAVAIDANNTQVSRYENGMIATHDVINNNGLPVYE